MCLLGMILVRSLNVHSVALSVTLPGSVLSIRQGGTYHSLRWRRTTYIAGGGARNQTKQHGGQQSHRDQDGRTPEGDA